MSYKTYESYKDSKNKFSGSIPYEWDEIKIKFFTDIFGRIGFRGYTTSDLVEEGEGAITLGPPNIENQKLFLENKKYLSWEKYDESPEIKIFNGDLLLVKTASVGKVALVKNLNEPTTINPQLVVFKNIKINNEYFYYALISDSIQQQISSNLKGGVIFTLTQEEIANYIIPLPNTKEQIQIANYLDKKTSEIDKNIAKDKKLIKLLEEKKVALIHHIVTKGLDPNVPMKETDIPWAKYMPTHWNVFRGKNILIQLKRFVKAEDEIITCFRDGEVTLRSKRRQDGFTMSDKEIGYQGIEKNDLVVHGMDGFAGAIGISDSRGKASPVYIVLNSNQSKKYVMYYLRNLAYNNVFLALSTGIRVRSCDLRWEKLANLLYVMPPLEEQEKIVDFLDENLNFINKSIEKIQEHIDLLVEYKTSLIHHVVTGKIDVSCEF